MKLLSAERPADMIPQVVVDAVDHNVLVAACESRVYDFTTATEAELLDIVVPLSFTVRTRSASYPLDPLVQRKQPGAQKAVRSMRSAALAPLWIRRRPPHVATQVVSMQRCKVSASTELCLTQTSTCPPQRRRVLCTGSRAGSTSCSMAASSRGGSPQRRASPPRTGALARAF